MDELDLIRRAQRGDTPAFNQLVEQYSSLAFNVAARTIGDRDAAADATQDAFLAAYRAIGGFRGGSFKSWLLRIVTNACYDSARRGARHPSSSLDLLRADEDSSLDPPDPGPHPETLALHAELLDHVQRMLLDLPFDQRTTLVLADLHGLSYEEIAEATAVAVGTVRSRLNRARLRMRELLRQRPELLPDRYRLEGVR